MDSVAIAPSVTGLLSSINNLSYHGRWHVLRPLRVAYDSDSSVQSLAAELSASTDFTSRFLAASIAGAVDHKPRAIHDSRWRARRCS